MFVNVRLDAGQRGRIMGRHIRKIPRGAQMICCDNEMNDRASSSNLTRRREMEQTGFDLEFQGGKRGIIKAPTRKPFHYPPGS